VGKMEADLFSSGKEEEEEEEEDKIMEKDNNLVCLKKPSVLSLILKSIRFLPNKEIISLLLSLTSDYLYLYISSSLWFQNFNSFSTPYCEDDLIIKMTFKPFSTFAIPSSEGKFLNSLIPDIPLKPTYENLINLPSEMIRLFNNTLELSGGVITKSTNLPKISHEFMSKRILLYDIYKTYYPVFTKSLPFISAGDESVIKSFENSFADKKNDDDLLKTFGKISFSDSFSLVQASDVDTVMVVSCQYSFSTMPLFRHSPRFIIKTLLSSFALSLEGGLLYSTVYMKDYVEGSGLSVGSDYSTPPEILLNRFLLYFYFFYLFIYLLLLLLLLF
jgi:hypothetical protein